MTRIIMWLLGTVTAVVLLFSYHTSPSSSFADAKTTLSAPAERGSGSGSTGDSSIGGSGDRASTGTGPVVQTEWGPVQVQISTDGDTISDVSVLQFPDGNPRDQQINAYALPILVQDTLDAQSANIDMVSGATVTSLGYVRSLQGALDEAGI